MKCHACGHDNAASALFCEACRRPLVAPTKLPPRLEPLATAAVSTAAMAVSPGGSVGDGSEFSRNRFAPPDASGRGRTGDESGVLTDEDAWGAVIGNSNAHYYLTRFERLSRGESAPWHWPAMLVTWYWLLYRKMWVGALIYFFAPWIVLMIVAAVLPSAAGPLTLLWWLALIIVPGVLGNGWYYRHCMNKIQAVRSRGGSKEQMVARLESAGGTSNIVVMIVAIFGIVAGIGILAAIALPAYQTYTFKAKVSEAVLVGAEVAASVGKQYEQTGALPSSSDVDGMVAGTSHHSKFVRSIDMDGSSGVLTVKVEASPSIGGSILLVPNADSNHRLTWTCTTEDLKRYVPASCRGQAASSR